MKTPKLIACAAGALALVGMASQPSTAAPTQMGTGNYYEFIQVLNLPLGPGNTAYPANSWASASAAVASSTFMGISGHLATITSAAENAFLLSIVTGSPTGFLGAWLGGRAGTGWLAGPESGNAFTHTNWFGVEPNNAGYIYMSIGTSTGPGQWLDDSIVPISGDGQGIPTFPNDPVIGYFVEYENPATVVPLPAALPLMAGGIGLMGLLGWRQRRRVKA